jgi:hypothetical protein
MQAGARVAIVDVRVGIHTGLVVAGEVGGADTRCSMAVVGETPNIAARIEHTATPGTVVVGERTRRLVGDVFDFEDLGPHEHEFPSQLGQILNMTVAQSGARSLYFDPPRSPHHVVLVEQVPSSGLCAGSGRAS